ncbi:Wzz/FepE/Etk N-terminal domain-containing protein [Pseudomonas sp. NPDC089422]|uniref:Wzz/FepE/Etk N-terminal domain-containing protein n=1 Tax=Pseudomonas sp. NPDC089422 TaxID=3364466 RepID=UPI003821BB5D
MSTDQVRLKSNNDEVDLSELVRELWKGRFLILSIALIFLLVAAVYVYIKAPQYEVKATVRAPSQEDIAALNIGRGDKSGLKLLETKDVYAVYLRNLQSESIRRKFFEDVYVPAMKAEGREVGSDLTYRQFSNDVRIESADASLSARASITLLAYQPQTAVYWVQLYSNLAAAQAARQLIDDVRSDAEVKASGLEQQIGIDRDSARRQREDKIIQLKEALQIARAVGLEKPPFISASLASELSSEISGGLAYMRGSKALEAEIATLEGRVSDDPYIPGLRQKQADLTFYRKLSIDRSAVEVYQLDGEVTLPDRPAKPQVVLILLAAVLLGVLVGLVLVFARKLLKDAGE